MTLPARLEENWTFRPSSCALKGRLLRARGRFRLRSAPPTSVLRPVTPAARWICYFAYLPDGHLDSARAFTLAKLAAMEGKLLTICAAPDPGDVPSAILDGSDAVIWKGLSGYDFSAYAIALREIAKCSPGADVVILNDSVYGPFGSLDPFIARTRWDLTGFTATGLIENHIQSYCFVIRDVTPAKLLALRPVLPLRHALDHAVDVIYLQESRFARVAARSMSVGAFWYAGGEPGWDPTLHGAEDLIGAGFPFLKRSLFGKYAGVFDEARLFEMLEERGHPLPDPLPGAGRRPL